MTDATLIRCDWCGTLVDERIAGWGGIATCSQSCHEARKLALHKTVATGGPPHVYAAPFQPERWGDYAAQRDAARERSRNAGRRAVASRTQARLSGRIAQQTALSGSL